MKEFTQEQFSEQAYLKEKNMELTARQLRTQEEIRIRKAAEQYRKKLERTVAGKRTMYAIARNPVLRINFLSTCINQK